MNQMQNLLRVHVLRDGHNRQTGASRGLIPRTVLQIPSLFLDCALRLRKVISQVKGGKSRQRVSTRAGPRNNGTVLYREFRVRTCDGVDDLRNLQGFSVKHSHEKRT